MEKSNNIVEYGPDVKSVYKNVFGVEPPIELQNDTPFQSSILYIFQKLCIQYGDGKPFAKSYRGINCLVFRLNSKVTNGVFGWCVCEKNSSLHYILSFWRSEPLGNNKAIMYLVAGYEIAGSKQLAYKDSQLEKSVPVFEIFGPSLSGKIGKKYFKADLLMSKIIEENILPLSNWILNRKSLFETTGK